ncbi:hypothetical protein FA15DRAFT_715834 [Coprinopsis marcescibilis]|uniref:CNH domain-containing protein n=1 Tax=Coprinopsis marcescibilis TaxID=230819 RepID=A0A5C3KNC1_COPMA|nr:hypothetical protein FA15DRAFT_715834 [Coprinopsis marcescibilis]
MAIPTNIDLPPYQVQTLLNEAFSQTSSRITCAQALGNDIYIGTSTGELFQFMSQTDEAGQLDAYIIVSRQLVPGEKPIEDIVLIPSISRALILSGRQIHFYSLPNLEPHPTKPIRNVMAFAVDDQHLRRPVVKANATLGYDSVVDPIEFSVVKRNGIAMFSLKDHLFYSREIPLPPSQGSTTVLAKRTGRYLCFADKENYNIVDLEGAQLVPLLPISQGPSPTPIKPKINVISENEFLILSWTGSSTLGLFVTGEGDPVRGTLEWPAYPLGICACRFHDDWGNLSTSPIPGLDYPFITTLLPDGSIEVHSVDTQAPVQVIGPPLATSPPTSPSRRHATSPNSPRAQNQAPNNNAELEQRIAMVVSVGGFQVPSSQRAECTRKVPFKLLRTEQGT